MPFTSREKKLAYFWATFTAALGIGLSVALFYILYGWIENFDRVPWWQNLLLALLPNLLGVMAVYVTAEFLKPYTLAQTQEQLTDIQEFLAKRVTELASKVQMYETWDDVPWKDVFDSPGPVRMVSNFFPLPLKQGNAALKSNLGNIRSGHVFVFADPTNTVLLDKIAATRRYVGYATTGETVKTSICETLVHLLKAVPDNCAASATATLDGIEVLFSSKALPAVSVWTDDAAFVSGIPVFPEDVAYVPRLLAIGDSGAAVRAYSESLIERVRPICRRPTIDELLLLSVNGTTTVGVDSLRGRIIR